MHTAHILIRGKVQGVGFRAFISQEAKARGIEGYVRNRRDGSVEAVLCGLRLAVEHVVELCEQGPPGSRVDRLERLQGEPPRLTVPGFHIWSLGG